MTASLAPVSNDGAQEQIKSLNQAMLKAEPSSEQRGLAIDTNSAGLSQVTDKISMLENSKITDENAQLNKLEPVNQSPEEMEEVASKLSDLMAMLRKGLSFSVDESLGKQVISVLDIDTGELIRQIPNEEALELAIKLQEKMAEMDGLLMSTEV
ncbi:flagellar protein FlaG [Shewanella pealeana]|nr:flagellar protein FlaG [Shewanella pealeana]